MIACLRGKLISISPVRAVVECAGVGYLLHVPLTTSDQIGSQIGTEVFLYTRAIYREDAAVLYGFYQSSEVEIFDFLRSLQGIGPALSLNLISHLGMQNLAAALLNHEVQMLTKVPGVGKVKAEKILFEAQTKKKRLQGILNESTSVVSASKEQSTMTQLEEALQSLGYQKKEIERAEVKINQNELNLPKLDSETLQDYLRIYLKYM